MICPLRQRAICRVVGRSVCGRRKGYSCSVTSQLPASSTGRVWANVREGSFITEGDEVLKLNSSVSRCVEPPGLERTAQLWHNVAAHDHVSADSHALMLYCTHAYIRLVWGSEEKHANKNINYVKCWCSLKICWSHGKCAFFFFFLTLRLQHSR